MNVHIKNTRISSPLIFGFSIIIVLVTTVIAVSLLHSKKITEVEKRIFHTHQILNNLKNIETSLLDLESGQRGYIITGDLGYLESHSQMLRNFDMKIEGLKKLASDNNPQLLRIEKLKNLIDSKVVLLNNTIAIRIEKGFTAAKKRIEATENKEVMNGIWKQISELRDEEKSVLFSTVSIRREAEKNTTYIHVILLFISVIIIVVVGLLIIRAVLKPLQLLQENIALAEQDNLGFKVGITSKNEMAQLSYAFQEMRTLLKNTSESRARLEEELSSRISTEKNLLKIKNSLEKSELALIESNKTKDKFFSIIAHDLRNPFNAMLGFSNLLMDDFKMLSEDKKLYYSKIIHVNIESTYSLLENLLQWSRSQIHEIKFIPEEENLYLFFNKVIKSLRLPAELKSIVIKNEIPQDILISVDENMLSTIIRNLIGNALKFTDNGGEITAFARLKNSDDEGGFVEVVISDTGRGLSEDVISELFTVSHNKSTIGTANERGTGLGLVLCKEFVEKHGGTIWVESELGKGASFYFTLQKASTLVL
ncbi:MAG: hypothetical protein COB98_05445 [Flavobacteriaceae bacterium]|nr:MAG: hypothetical protein COB98_05445 [Flavobacteriaceae bacterium]